MSLDPFVRCSCIRDGRAKAHPFPEGFTWDEAGSPSLSGDPTEEEGEAHDRWVQESREHEGYLVSESLGSITRAKNVREFLRGLQGEPGPKFPILLKKVVYDGTHTGDWLPVKESLALLREVDLVLGSSDILTEGREGILPKYEAAVRGLHCDGEYDNVLNQDVGATDLHGFP
jgi:hypothetical protein